MEYMAEKYPIMVILTVTIILIGTSTYIVADTQLDQQKPTDVKMRTDKDLYKCNETVTVKISGKPNTTYLLVIKDPNGNMYTQINITTDASGNATQTYTQVGPSGVWLLELYEITTAGDKRLVAEWKYKVECENPPPPTDKSCLTVVSDLQTFVDRGNTVPVSYYWPAPINGSDLGIPGATPIWSSNGLDTNNPYTFTKHFILPQGYTYHAKIAINADDQWKDLRINGNFIADEPAPIGWGNVHTYTIPSTYLNAGLNTLTVQAVDIGQAVAALAFKMEVFCTPVQSSIHWDKIVFTIDVKPLSERPGQQDKLKAMLAPLLNKTLDIKVRDNPADIAALEDVVKGFLAAKYNLTKQDTERIIVRIVEVEYAIDTNVHGAIGPEKPKEAESSTKGSALNSNDGYIYYTLPFIGIGALIALWYKRSRTEN
jgi:hypothetical protein